MGSPYTAVRRIQFCAGHRVNRHESKCRNPHGHNYVAFFYAEAEPGSDDLDELGRVVDFSVLKERLGGWVDKFWDHGFIYMEGDEAMRQALVTFSGEDEGGVKTFQMRDNPTAENMAHYLLHSVGPAQLIGTGVRLVRVVLWETENCFADVRLEERCHAEEDTPPR